MKSAFVNFDMCIHLWSISTIKIMSVPLFPEVAIIISHISFTGKIVAFICLPWNRGTKGGWGGLEAGSFQLHTRSACMCLLICLSACLCVCLFVCSALFFPPSPPLLHIHVTDHPLDVKGHVFVLVTTTPKANRRRTATNNVWQISLTSSLHGVVQKQCSLTIWPCSHTEPCWNFSPQTDNMTLGRLSPFLWALAPWLDEGE